MGEVWRARDTKLGREVAIKTLPEAFAADPDRRARFEREAKLLASFKEPTMKSQVFVFLLAAGVACVAAVPVVAHHSFAAEYDADKPITVTGTITKVEWMNPHIYFYVDVRDQDGSVANWAVEGGTPNRLRRRGWGRDSLRVGDQVTVEGFMARKPGITQMNGRVVTLQDGRRVFASGPEDGGPQ